LRKKSAFSRFLYNYHVRKISDFIKNDPGLGFSLLCFTAALLLCQLQRLALYLSFHSFFANIGSADLFWCFIKAFVFDASICVTIFGLPLLLMNIPGTGKKWLKSQSIFFTVLFVCFAILLAADYFYFPEAHRHIAEELKWIFNEMGFFISYAFTKGLPALTGIIILSGAMIYGFFRLADKTENKRKTAAYHITKLVLLAAVLFLLQRGGFVRKNIGVADVFKYARTNEEAVLVMNGVFSAVNISRKKTVQVTNNYPFDEAVSAVKTLVLSKGEKWNSSKYFPLMRNSERELETAGKTHNRLNIFFVMLEAWKPDSIDSLSGGKTLDTPVFDDIVKNGLVFTNAYATGTRSIYGFAGIFASLPLVPGLPVFGYGLELNSFSPVFRLFGENGYSTSFTQASHSDSYRMCSLAKAMGADGSWGWEHIPQKLDYKFTPDYGYDYETLMFAADKAAESAALKRPFFAAAFTASTHSPFGKLLDEERFNKYPNDSWEHGYRNSLRYSDWSIGEVIKKARHEGWFDDTVFIFMSDHNQHVSGSSDRETFHIPLVIYSPKHIKPGRRDYVVSQLDILPTLAETGGIKQPFSSIGRSVFDTSRPGDRFALNSYGGDDFGIITADGSLRHNMQKITAFENKTGKADKNRLEARLLQSHRIFYQLMRQNRWFGTDTATDVSFSGIYNSGKK